MKRHFVRNYNCLIVGFLLLIVSGCKTNSVRTEYTYYHSGNVETKKVFYVPGDTSTYTFYVYYPSGKLRAIVPYKHSKRNGTRILYYENGNIESIAHFKDDKFWGVVHEYYDDGSNKKTMLVINDYNMYYLEYLYHKKLKLTKEKYILPSRENDSIYNYVIGEIVYDTLGNIIDSMSGGLYLLNNKMIFGSFIALIAKKDTIKKNEKFCFAVKLLHIPENQKEIDIYLGKCLKKYYILEDTIKSLKLKGGAEYYKDCISPQDTGYNLLLGHVKFYDTTLEDTVLLLFFKEYFVQSQY